MQNEIIPKKYIELDSTFRNRNLYPNPAQFKVKILNQGQRLTSVDADDPVSNGESNFLWRGAEDAAITMTGVPSAPIVTFNVPGDFSVFRGQFLVDQSIASGDQSSLITFFSEYSSTAFLETPFGDEWTSGDIGVILNQSDDENVLFTIRTTTFDGQFIGQLLYDMTIGEYRTIIDYDDKFRILKLDTPFGGTFDKTDDFTIVKERAVSTDFLTNPGTTDLTVNTITLPAIESSVDDIYKDKYVKIVQFINSIGTGQFVSFTRLITSYDGTTKIATFTPSIDLSVFSIIADVNYQILNFTKDISSSLSSYIDENTTATLYNISLNNLVLPNVTIRGGGTTANHPYVYVVFANNLTRTRSLMNSNNPNSNRAVFRCPITDVDNSEISTFIKVRSEMVNTFFFNPKDDLYFEVYLPNGDLFEPLIQETEPPKAPNPLIQMSCVVSFEEIK